MHEALVDADDFPMQDLDIYQIRHVRQKIICKVFVCHDKLE